MNSRRKFLRNIAGASAGLAFTGISQELLAKQDLLHISVLHTNDIHCHIDPFPETNPSYAGRGGLARLSALIKGIREENNPVLLVDAGDMFQGTPYFNFYKGELIMKVMTKVGYEASTIGNHEFDNGLEGIEQSLKYAGFPLICSNYDFSQTILRNRFPEYRIFNKNGIKIGLYGLGVEMAGLVAENNYAGTVYLDPVTTARKMEIFLKNERNCDLVICLSHLGLKYRETKISDTLLAGQTRMTDLIIGGHTHSYLKEPLQLKNAEGKRIIVNQAAWAGLMLGRVDFILDRERREKPVALAQNIFSGS
ncbi:MAG: bifunctional UDP-sugar hydrolase/5'-nucleotidase [Mangrovibacterium sp.]